LEVSKIQLQTVLPFLEETESVEGAESVEEGLKIVEDGAEIVEDGVETVKRRRTSKGHMHVPRVYDVRSSGHGHICEKGQSFTWIIGNARGSG
jgi:hypothetical protein